MKRAHFRVGVIKTPREQSKLQPVFGWLILLTALTLALLTALPRPAKADSWRANQENQHWAYPSQVFMYPRATQSPMQQDRDRYECHLWAMRHTGYDPSLPPLTLQRTVRVEPVPPIGHDTAVLGFTGALLGAVIGGYRHAPEGALIGGTIGALTGLASDSARAETARRMEAAENQQSRELGLHTEERASAYRRAMGACLEGRGYTVK